MWHWTVNDNRFCENKIIVLNLNSADIIYAVENMSKVPIVTRSLSLTQKIQKMYLALKYWQ